MKRNLFTAALLFVVYCLVVVFYSFAAENGMIGRSVDELGLARNSTLLHQTAVHEPSSQPSLRSFIDPIPDPPFPRPKPLIVQAHGSIQDNRLASTSSFIDPVPDPPFPRPKPPVAQTHGGIQDTRLASTSSFVDPIPDPPFPRPKPPQA